MKCKEVAKSQTGNYGQGFQIKCKKVIQVNDSSACMTCTKYIKLPIYGICGFRELRLKNNFVFILFDSNIFASENSKDIDLVSKNSHQLDYEYRVSIYLTSIDFAVFDVSH